MEAAYAGEEFFHGPCECLPLVFILRIPRLISRSLLAATWVQRFHHVTMPLLRNIANELNRPQILHPTMIELSAGFWDLRAMTEQDFISRGIPRPYPMDSPIPFSNIGEEREKRWAGNAAEIIKLVASTFQGEKGVRDGPVITWRSLHSPKRNSESIVSSFEAARRSTCNALADLAPHLQTTLPTLVPSRSISLLAR